MADLLEHSRRWERPSEQRHPWHVDFTTPDFVHPDEAQEVDPE